MSDAFIVRPLKCRHCGAELPIMGQLVTFQCQTCFKHWVLSASGLEPVVLYRAMPAEESGGEPVYLPFWMIEVDTSRIRDQVTTAVEEIRMKTRTIAGTRLEPERESDFDTLLRENLGGVQGIETSNLVATAAKAVSAPNSAEVNNLLRRLESIGTYYVYVPAFQSANTYAYLKVGRLLTKRQPRFEITKPADVPRSVLCALQADEALALIDFVFFATLPGSIQQSGDLLERIHLAPSKQPFLVEFPFLQHRNSYESLVVDFHISSKLVEQ